MKNQNEKTNLDDEVTPRMHQGAIHHLFQNARELRERMTLAEGILWEELKMKKLDGFKFRRQHPIGIHILDFYCHQKKLGVELDGGYHEKEEQKILDEKRTEILNLQNIKIIRFRNEEIINQMILVLGKIRTVLTPDP
mgnify:FL=1|jgi:very-short-patch-repair endonuclease